MPGPARGVDDVGASAGAILESPAYNGQIGRPYQTPMLVHQILYRSLWSSSLPRALCAGAHTYCRNARQKCFRIPFLVHLRKSDCRGTGNRSCSLALHCQLSGHKVFLFPTLPILSFFFNSCGLNSWVLPVCLRRRRKIRSLGQQGGLTVLLRVLSLLLSFGLWALGLSGCFQPFKTFLYTALPAHCCIRTFVICHWRSSLPDPPFPRFNPSVQVLCQL